MITETEKRQIQEKLKSFDLTYDSLAMQFSCSRVAIARWMTGDLQSKRLDAAIPAFVKGLEVGASTLV
jgi:hypothetical protein